MGGQVGCVHVVPHKVEWREARERRYRTVKTVRACGAIDMAVEQPRQQRDWSCSRIPISL